jgi:hypothetical protein
MEKSTLPSLNSILSSAEVTAQTINEQQQRSFGRSRVDSSRRVEELVEELNNVEEQTERLRSISQRSSSLGFKNNQNPLVVQLSGVEMRNSAPVGKKEKLYVAYVIEVNNGNVQWRVARRFSEFYSLHLMLRKYCKKIASKLPKLPSKRMKVGMSKFNPKYTLERRQRLETYLVGLVDLVQEVKGNDIVDDFLEYTENMILASVKALRSLPELMSIPQSTQIADLLQTSINKSKHKRHFSRKNYNDSDGSGNSTDDESTTSDLPSETEYYNSEHTIDRGQIGKALTEMCDLLDHKFLEVDSLKEGG